MILYQVLAEMYHCSPAIRDADALLDALVTAAKDAGATVLDRKVVNYVPHGSTVAVFLAESHVIITTWPEHDLLLLDVLLCNPQQSQDIIVGEVASRFCPDGQTVIHRVPRHIAPEPLPQNRP